MYVDKKNLKSGILALLVVTIMVTSAFVAVSTNNATATADDMILTENGGEEGPEVSTPNLSDTVSTLFSMIDFELGNVHEKDPSSMEIFSGTVNISETKECSKSIYIDEGTILNFSNDAYINVAEYDIYIAKDVQINVDGNKKIFEFSNGSMYLAGLELVSGNVTVTTSSVKLLSDYAKDISKRTFGLNIDIQGTDEKAVFSIEETDGTDVTIRHITNNPNGSEVSVSLDIDLDAFLKAYGESEVQLSTAFKILKGLAENKSNMPLFKLDVIVNNICEDFSYDVGIEHHTDSTRLHNLSTSISTAEANQYLSVYVKFDVFDDKSEIIFLDYGLDNLITQTSLKNVEVRLGYDTDLKVQIKVGSIEYTDKCYQYRYWTGSNQSEFIDHGINSSLDGVELNANGSVGKVLGLIETIYNNLDDFTEISKYLEENAVIFSLNVKITLDKFQFNNDDIVRYSEEKFEEKDMEPATLIEKMGNPDKIDSDLFKVSDASVTLVVDTRSNVTLEVSGSITKESTYYTEYYEDLSSIDTKLKLRMELSTKDLTTVALGIAGVYNSEDNQMKKVKGYLGVLSNSDLGPYTVNAEITESKAVNNGSVMFDLKNLAFVAGYSDKLRIGASLESLVSDYVEEWDAGGWTSGDVKVRNCAKLSMDIDVKNVNLNIEGYQSGLLELIADSISDAGEINFEKILLSTGAYAGVSIDLTFDKFKYSSEEIRVYYESNEKVKKPWKYVDFDTAKRYQYEQKNFDMNDFSLDIDLDTKAGYSFDISVNEMSAGYMSGEVDDPTELYQYGILKTMYNNSLSVSGLHLSLKADTADAVTVFGAVLKYYLDKDASLTDESKIYAFLEYVAVDSTVSFEICLDNFKLEMKEEYIETGALINSETYFLGSDGIPAGSDKAVSLELTLRYVHDKDAYLKGTVQVNLSFTMADNASFRYEYISVGEEKTSAGVRISDADLKVTLSQYVDLVTLIKGASIDDLIGGFDTKVVCTIDNINLISNENGKMFVLNLNNLEFNILKRISEIEELTSKIDSEESLEKTLRFIGIFDNKIGSMMVGYGEAGIDAVTLDKSKPFVEVVFYNGTIDAATDRVCMKFEYRTVTSTRDGYISGTVGDDGKCAGTIFVFDSEGISYGIFGNGGNPEYGAERLYVIVPEVEISINNGATKYYPAGTQIIVSSDDAECLGWIVNGEFYKIGDVVTLTNDSTIVEKFPAKYTVTFVSFGETIDFINDIEGTDVTFPSVTEVSGYIFIGWDIEISKIGTSDVVVTALWSKIVSSDDVKPGINGSAVIDQKDSSGIDIKADDLKKALDKADEGSKNVILNLSNGVSMSLPESAVLKISGVENNQLGFKILTVKDTNTVPGYSGLSDDMKSKVNNGVVISINVANAASVTDLGKVRISLPYTLKEGESPENIVVYYIDASGNMTRMNGGYENSMVWFETDHFSDFAVVYEVPATNDDQSNLLLYVAIIAIAIVLVAAVFVVRARKA